jgi:hypothetical protein
MGMPMGMGVPVPFAAAGAQFGPLIRMGGSVPVQDSPVAARRGARASERSEAPLGSRLGPAPPANDLVMSEPLPEPPRPLDPVSRSGAALRARELTVSFSASTRRAEAVRGPGQRRRWRGWRACARVLAAHAKAAAQRMARNDILPSAGYRVSTSGSQSGARGRRAARAQEAGG